MLSLMQSDWNDIAIYANIDLNPSRSPIVVSFEELVAEDASNFITVLHSAYTASRDFKNEMNAAMAAAFGTTSKNSSFHPLRTRESRCVCVGNL